MNVKILWIVSRLVGPQEGLSMSSLSVEKFTLQTTRVIILYLLGFWLKWGTELDTTFYQNIDFRSLNFTEIDFGFNYDT